MENIDRPLVRCSKSALTTISARPQSLTLTLGNILIFRVAIFFWVGPLHATQLLSQRKAARTVPLHSPLVKHTPAKISRHFVGAWL